MDLRKLKTLIDLVSESNVSELEITEPEGKIRIVKASVAAAPAQAQVQPASGSAAKRAPGRPGSCTGSGRRGSSGAARGHRCQVPDGGYFLPVCFARGQSFC